MNTISRTALITGASAGIGAAFAHEFGRHGYNLVLVARREEKLGEVANRVTAAHAVEVNIMPLDLAESDAGDRLASQLSAEGIHVDALVNNAGYALNGGLLDVPFQDHLQMQQVMLTSYFELCYRFLPGMAENRFGRIINVSSLAAVMPATPGSLYGAIKRYINDMSLAVDYEFRPRGIHCSAICPGFTYTEFHDVMGVRKRVSRLPKYMWQAADEVAAEGYAAVMEGRRIVVCGRFNRLWSSVMNRLPSALQRRLVQRK
ncbi:MAG: SDR family NAD(P)-dependent oxidoreductase [Pseudomonadota bacterium]